jgi:signal peptidase
MRVVVGGLAAIVVLAATAAMVVPAGPQQLGVISAERDSPGPRIIEQGTTEQFTLQVANGGVVPTVSMLEPSTDGVAVDPDRLSVGAWSQQNATVSLTAPPETGYYRYYLTEHRFLHVLPVSVIESLYGIHSWAPILVIDLLLGGAFYLGGMWLAGTGRIRRRTRDGRTRS